MKTNHQILQKEMAALIKNSCAISTNVDSKYYSFQKSLLKFFFGVVDVIIDYQAEKIILVKSVPANGNNNPLYVQNETTLIEINYTDLESTLLECLETGEKQTRFYKSLLFHYNHVTAQVGAWSA